MSGLGSFRENAIRFVVNLFARNMLVCVLVYSCWIAIINYNYWFSWHVILCTLGVSTSFINCGGTTFTVYGFFPASILLQRHKCAKNLFGVIFNLRIH
jgi:hypothetical protein